MRQRRRRIEDAHRQKPADRIDEGDDQQKQERPEQHRRHSPAVAVKADREEIAVKAPGAHAGNSLARSSGQENVAAMPGWTTGPPTLGNRAVSRRAGVTRMTQATVPPP